MKKFLKIVLIVFISSSVKAEIVNQIVINGNNRVSDETVKIYGEIELKKDYSDKDLNNILKNLYDTEFFEDVNVQLKNNVLTVNLKEYQSINKLTIVGEKSSRYQKEIKKVIKLKEKKSFIKSFLASDIEKIKKLYSSLGYNFSKIDTKIKELEGNKVDLIIEIDRGSKTKISSIKFIGDKKVRDKRLRDIIASEEDKFWKVLSRNTSFNQSLLNLDERLLRNYYKSIGYYNVEVTSKTANLNKEGNIDLTFSINAGTRYTINKIKTNLDSVFDKNIFFPLEKFYSKEIGEYYSPFKVKKLLDQIDDVIEKNNLQFVEHNVKEEVQGEGIIITFNIFEGERTLVERINITGNNITSEEVIRGELLLDEGDPFTNLGLQKSISKIKSRRIFSDVSFNVSDGSKSNLKIIDIDVEEQPTGEISAGAGIGTDGGSFAFTISENNWLGQGKKVDFDIEVNEESISGELNFTDPNYDFLGNSLNYYLASTSNDKPDQGYENSLFTAGISTTFEQYKDIFATFGIASSYDDLRTDGSASDSLKKQAGEFTELVGRYGFKYDKRNRAFMPTSGSVISFSQDLPILADRPFIGNNFGISSYKEFSEDIIGASKFYFSSVNGMGEDVRLSKRKNLSSYRLRGFKKNKVGPKDGTDHVGGNYVASLNLETNLPKLLPDTTKTDVGLFLDFGNVWAVDYDSSIDDSNKIRSSTGVALNWSSPIGPMSFILSTNLQKASTDETESFRFNLGTTF